MCVLSMKVPIQKKSRNLFNAPRIYNVHLCILTSNGPFSDIKLTLQLKPFTHDNIST